MNKFPLWKVIMVLVICLTSIVFSLPSIFKKDQINFLPQWIAENVINLGLDLRGGSHLLLEVDFQSYLNEQCNFLKDEIRNILKKEKIPVSEIKIYQNEIIIHFPESEYLFQARQIVKKTLRDVDVSDDQNNLVVAYTNEALKNIKNQVIQQSIEIIRRRVDETGTREPIIQRQGDEYILLQVPGLDNPLHLKEMLGKTAKLSFHMVNLEAMTKPSMVLPFNSLLLKSDEKDRNGKDVFYIVYKQSVLNGNALTDARVHFDEYGKAVVSFKFNNYGARKFGEITKNHSGEVLAIILDDKVVSAPRIDEPIMGGAGIIRGNFTSAEANELALLLRAGALPAPLKVIEERSVGPSLGSDSIDAGLKAAVIGTVAVMIFMLICYGIFGIFANIALLFNLFFIISILSVLGATLTMPGIAGIVLTMGMAVDANVLIFERIREESKLGMSTLFSIDRGFNQAYATIMDSNLTTIFATLILYFFGSGAVKGFAVTLMIGVISSMFSSITITKLMIQIYFRKSKVKSQQLV